MQTKSTRDRQKLGVCSKRELGSEQFNMVYCGIPSKACAECRARRTKVSVTSILYLQSVHSIQENRA